MGFEDRLRARRNELSLSLRDIADACGVAPPTVYRWETGEISSLRADRIESLARVLHCSPAYLMGWEEYDGSDYFGEKSRGKVWDVVENLVDNPDKQFDRVLDAWAQLNEEGHERVAEQAELLVASGKYKKDGASRVVGDA